VNRALETARWNLIARGGALSRIPASSTTSAPGRIR